LLYGQGLLTAYKAQQTAHKEGSLSPNVLAKIQCRGYDSLDGEPMDETKVMLRVSI
jgi:hypothetical protein